MPESVVVKMYKANPNDTWQEEPVEHPEDIAYFIKVVDPDFTVNGGEYKKKVMYFKLGHWYDSFGSKEHPFVREMK